MKNKSYRKGVAITIVVAVLILGSIFVSLPRTNRKVYSKKLGLTITVPKYWIGKYTYEIDNEDGSICFYQHKSKMIGWGGRLCEVYKDKYIKNAKELEEIELVPEKFITYKNGYGYCIRYPSDMQYSDGNCREYSKMCDGIENFKYEFDEK